MKVTPQLLSGYIRFRRQHCASDGMINRELRILRRAFNLAVQENRLSRSSVQYFELLPEHNAREGFSEKGDIYRIISQLCDTDVHDYVLWGFWTRMRKGEIGKLTWAAFDKETWMLTLPWSEYQKQEAAQARPRRHLPRNYQSPTHRPCDRL